MRKYSSPGSPPNLYILFHATMRLALRERLLERVALRVRVREAVLLRVRLELLTPPARLEEEGVIVAGSREGELL